MQGYQKQYLKGLAHAMKPTVLIGQKGLQDAVLDAIETALNTHELIKIKFIDYKEKQLKDKISDAVAKKTGAEKVATIGHTAILYRQQKDPRKRKIQIPRRGHP